MSIYLNTATNHLRSREMWILSLPQGLLAPSETWDSLFIELLDLGLFVEASEVEVAEEWEPSPGPQWGSTPSVYPSIVESTESKGVFHE